MKHLFFSSLQLAHIQKHYYTLPIVEHYRSFRGPLGWIDFQFASTKNKNIAQVVYLKSESAFQKKKEWKWVFLLNKKVYDANQLMYSFKEDSGSTLTSPYLFIYI